MFQAKGKSSRLAKEEPQRDTSAAHERWWEDHRSSPGSPEEEHDAEHDRYEPYFEVEEEVMEEAVAVWEGEIAGEDEMIDRVTSLLPTPGFYTRLVLFAQGKLMEALNSTHGAQDSRRGSWYFGDRCAKV